MKTCNSELQNPTYTDKRRKAILFIVVAASLLNGVFALAQSYRIGWSTIAGGGGTSTSAVYSVTGTIGNSPTTMTNGPYFVTGGFWALPIAVQTSGAPKLTIILAAPGLARIAWTPAAPGFVLQESSSLASTNWVNALSGANNPVTVPVPEGRKFYRLFKPEIP